MADTTSAAPSEPVAGQCRFVGAKWSECAVEHVAMVLANPAEWEGYEVRYLYAAPQPVARREPTVAFDDPRVQAVYEILCDDTDWPPKETPQQHWDGWIARRIVERLFQDPVVREPLTVPQHTERIER